MRRFLNKRNLLIALGVVVCVAVSTVAGFLFYLNSDAFNERVRRSLVQEIEAQTGGNVSVGKIRWNLREQRLVLEDLTLRGTEPQGELPLAHIESITAGLKLRNLLQKRLDLFELSVLHPQLRLLVAPDGRTNLPGPPKRVETRESTFAISISNFKVIQGAAFVNDRQTNLDFNLASVASDSVYNGDTEVLSVKLAYTGTLTGKPRPALPYTLSADFDFTRGTVVAKSVEVTSGKSTAKLQGRIDHALTAEIAAKLDYTGTFETTLLNHFLPKEKFGGSAKATGSMEFKRDSFSTKGSLAAERAQLNEWNATGVRSKYSYNYPEKKLNLTQLSAKALGGSATGTISASPLPGEPRVTLDLNYADIDGAQLARAYPWDSRYVLYARLTGQLHGWFEGRIERFEVEGDSQLASYTPPALPGVIAFPATGTASFVARPAEVELKASDIRFFDTTIQAYGRIHETQTDLHVRLKSSNLANLHFLNKDANGEGSFDGTVKGPVQTPLLDGAVVLDHHKHGEWNIQHAEGAVALNTQTNIANLTNVRATIGQSVATVNGTASTDGANVNLRVRSDRIRAEDFGFLLKEKVEGLLTGDVLVTSLTPLKVRGHVAASKLSARGRTFEAVEGDLTFADPVIEVENLTASERGARLTDGRGRFNMTTEEMDFQANVVALNLNRIRDLGIPDTLDGNIQRARIYLSGTPKRPRVSGDAMLENLAFRGEVFPRARLQLATEWPILTAVLSEAGNVDLAAKIDLSNDRYPFDATARFQNYSLEKIARFSHGSLTASGSAVLKGSLRGAASLSGTGVIQSIHTRIDDYPFDGTKPFAFSFDPNQLKLTDQATLNGPRGTKVNIGGSIGLTNTPKLDLTADGNVDLRSVAELSASWSITGIVSFSGRITGTSEKPNIDGVATLQNASLGYEGIYTTLSGLNGNLRFNENRVTFDDLEGRVSGGKIQVRGTGLIQNGQMEGLDVRIDTDRVRFRYPAGLSSVINGPLIVRGTSNEPLLDGNLTIDSMTYRSDFEPFLATFRPGGLDSGGTIFDRMRLAIHVAGNRNIVIQNEVADISRARVNLDIKGTLGSPSMTGHLEVNDGTLLIQGKRYDITRGNIDFVDPLRIDPVVDIQAESDLRDYRVILRVAGRGENVRVEMTSDPPLSQLELVNLVAGGKTLRELEEAGATKLPTNDEQFQGTAVSVMADLLRSKLGNRFGLLGLDRVKIDPYLVGAGNKSAQITLSVTRDLSVTYSQDLSSNQQRVIQVEYFLSKNLSLVASREENNESTALGLDIRLRKRF